MSTFAFYKGKICEEWMSNKKNRWKKNESMYKCVYNFVKKMIDVKVNVVIDYLFGSLAWAIGGKINKCETITEVKRLEQILIWMNVILIELNKSILLT